jgi:predicted regulator of Ras-like GTPase activity (Roadblock/LC7/MglB family)
MSIGEQLDQTLKDFEEKTEGILGSCVIISSQALMMAEASHHYDRAIIQGMSERFIRLANDTIQSLIPNGKLRSITLEEAEHFVYVRPVNEEYHVVVLTDRSETMGLREMNIKALITKLNAILNR